MWRIQKNLLFSQWSFNAEFDISSELNVLVANLLHPRKCKVYS